MKAYYYLFYKLYKFWETAPARFWSDWKACISITALEIWLILSIINYYNIFVDRYFQLEKTLFFVIGGIIIVGNYILFIYIDSWKEYYKEFECFSKRKNIIGGIVAWSIIILIIANLIISFYLMSQIDWGEYR